jgi:hypothetical protein
MPERQGGSRKLLLAWMLDLDLDKRAVHLVRLSAPDYGAAQYENLRELHANAGTICYSCGAPPYQGEAL